MRFLRKRDDYRAVITRVSDILFPWKIELFDGDDLLCTVYRSDYAIAVSEARQLLRDQRRSERVFR